MPPRRTQSTFVTKEPLWYKDAIIYELHVRAFCDSNDDGIGDLNGLTQKLPYLQDLGVTAIWILPFYPSPLRDDGYDIADYYSIHPTYGTLKDFRNFLDKAHEREMRVITELVVNHTSDQHPWFQRSRRAAPGSHWRDFYVWSQTPEKYKAARIIFRDFEHSNWAWDNVANAYFWHRFYSHQPDLNYDNPAVHKEMLRVLDFWFDMGVDGLRLDAVPYLYEREGTSCENLPETHEFLKKLRSHVDQKYGDRMLLAEANQWPEDAVTYFGGGKGDECHMAFHFPLMPRMFMAIRMEDRAPVMDILDQTPAIPETSQWALFLRNHDELTLEMVTDEERDYMYRVYANDTRARINLGIRRRLGPLLGNDRKRIELLHMLLFSLPGTPVLYYGDEIGMGDNVYLGDRNGVRTPMQWSSDRNAGFSRATPQALYLPIVLEPEYHYEAVNVDVQQRNPHSLFWWVKRAITLRKRYVAFGRGSIEFLHVDNRKVLAFVRRHGAQTILVVANLSRFTQPAELDLSAFEGHVPVEIFGQAAFPQIHRGSYFLTLGPHSSHWFLIEPSAFRNLPQPLAAVPELVGADHGWESLLHGPARARLEAVLLRHIANKSRPPATPPRAVRLRDAIPIGEPPSPFRVLLLNLESADGEPHETAMPFSIIEAPISAAIERDSPQLIVARLKGSSGEAEAILCEAMAQREFLIELFALFSKRKPFKAGDGLFKAVARTDLRSAADESCQPPEPQFRIADPDQSTIVYGNRFFLKLHRRIEPGPNPDLQLARFLNRKNFASVSTMMGWLEYAVGSGYSITLATVREFLPDAQDARTFLVDTATRYFERVRAMKNDALSPPDAKEPLMRMAASKPPDAVIGLIGTPLELARILGHKTAEMHLALSSEPENKDFAPEPFTPFYQRSLFQSLRNTVTSNLSLLRRSTAQLSPSLKPLAAAVANLEADILKSLRKVHAEPIEALRIRCHGSYHLGQLLYTGKDFLIVGFDGHKWKPFGERRIRHSGFYDVASMLRSLWRVSHAALAQQVAVGGIEPADVVALEPWSFFWFRWASSAYLKAYLGALQGTLLSPAEAAQQSILLRSNLVGGCFHDLGHALAGQPDRLAQALEAILHLAGPKEGHRPPLFEEGS